MCKVCGRLRAAGAPADAFPKHLMADYSKRRPKKTLEEKIAERKIIRDRKYVAVPARFATNEARVARLRKIRGILNKTQAEFAVLLGISFSFMRKMDYNERPVSMVYLKLAEKLLQEELNRRDCVRRRYAKKNPSAAQPEPAIPMPNNPKLRLKAIMLHMKNVSRDEIAQQLAMRPEVIDNWISNLD